jgi:hypothetical protein
MRRIVAAVVVVIALVVGSAHAQGGFAFCVKPGMLVNAAQVGYKSDVLFAGLGCEFATVGLTSKYSRTDSTYEPPYSYSYTSKYDVSLFLPQVALRYFFGGTDAEGGGGGVVRPYAAASVFYTLSAVRIQTSDGETTHRDTTSERQLRDVLNGNVGGTVAFGGEYFFSSGFSIGGEFGCRMLFAGQKSSYESPGYSYVSSNTLGLGVTYTTLGLNFYF